MPLPISSDAVIEKNKLTSDSTWLVLLEIAYPGEDIIYACLNNENITWNGNTWLRTIFNFSGMNENKGGETPNITLSIIDPRYLIIPLLKQFGGGIGAEVVIRIVNSKYLSNIVPEMEESAEILDTIIDENAKITFTLGAEVLYTLGCPPGRFLKNHCRFKFKGSDGRCGYTGSETECNRSIARCKELDNFPRYGGCPGIGTSGVQV